MSSDFWSRKLAGAQPAAPQQSAPQPASGNEPAWWQAAPTVRYSQPQQRLDGNQALPGGVTIEQLARMDASGLSQEALEMVASYKLQNQKYDNHCPHCGPEGNFVQSGNSMARCFNCGYSTRDIHSETGLQPTSKLRAGDSYAIDGGQGTGVTGGKGFGRLPAEYVMRARPNGAIGV